MKVFLITLAILVASMAILCVRLFAGRRFVRTHVDQNPHMRRRGIRCVQSQDAEARISNGRHVSERGEAEE